MRAKLAGWLTILVVLAACAEVLSFAALSIVPQFDRFLYRPPAEVTRADYQEYLGRRDPVLGWPGPGWLEKVADARGARLSPANAALGDVPPCISVYGDSFTFSAEVGDADTWPNLLTERLGCRVDNYGVGGFGLDQALLRLEGHLADGRALGDKLILALYPDNLNRNMNQWRFLLTRQPLSFKPAFHVTSDVVALAPMFDGDFDAFRTLMQDPAAFLPAETYLPDSGHFRRPRQPGFPYALTMGALILDQIRSFRGFGTSGRTNFYNYPPYYDGPSGPSDDKKAVATHIIGRFATLCADHDKDCAFLIIPDGELVLQHTTQGGHDLRPWLEAASAGLTFLDGAEIFRDVEDLCTHSTEPQACGGHYNPAGYARLAEFVAAAFAAK